jgi:hypothetical protein
MTIFSRNIPAQSSEVCQKCLSWSEHAIERKTERKINLDVSNISMEYVLSLPHYTNNGCFHYCDSKVGVTYYVRYDRETNEPEIVTIIKRNPIAMARRICEIKGWEFNNLCRDHLFGNCRRGSSCKYEHKTI